MTFACLFVCLWLFVPLENFSLKWRRHHCRWKAANFDLCSALMPIEEWGFFSVPHLLWYGPTVYNGHLRGPVTLIPVAERLAVELSLPVFTSWVFRGWDSNTQLPHAKYDVKSHLLTCQTPWQEIPCYSKSRKFSATTILRWKFW